MARITENRAKISISYPQRHTKNPQIIYKEMIATKTNQNNTEKELATETAVAYKINKERLQ